MKSLKYLNKYLYKYRWRLLLGVLFIIIANVFGLLPAQVIRYAFDEVKEAIITYQLQNTIAAKQSFYDELVKTLLLFGCLVFALAILKGLFTFFMRQTIIIMSRLIEYDLKNEIYAHYQKLDLAFYKRHNTGDLMNRISEDVNRVRMYLGPSIMYSINLTVLCILVITTMFTVNVELSLYVLLPLPFLSITIYFVSTMINKKSERVQHQLSRLTTYVQETFSGIRVIKAFAREEAKEKVFDRECNTYKDKSLDLVKTDALFQPMMILLIGLSTILTIYIGGRLAISGDITTGNIAEFVIYVNMLTWPVAAIGWVTTLIQRAAASQERINEFLNTKPEIINPVKEETYIKGKIVFKDVSFTYPDSGIEALKNVSFEVEKGKSLAIIGKTGSGKSTIANLICQLYNVNEGDIFIDNKNIQSINLQSLRRHIGYAPQDVFLFSDTIFNNIAFGYIDATSQTTHSSLTDRAAMQKAVEQAAKDAAIYSNIIEFPKSFNTYVGERGVTLSGGQKQRIAIARAIINHPNILIFDDCFSAVDTETEEIIIFNLKRIMKGKTSIIISHRTSSVKHADNIIILDEGQVAECGNHTNLIDKKGIYHDLYQKQLLEKRRKNEH